MKKLRKVSPEFVRADEGEREYNAQAWDKNLDRFLANYDDIEFYYAEPTEHTRYGQFFAIYTLRDEGLRLLNRFSTSGGISSAGFLGVNVCQVLEDDRSFDDVLELAKTDAKAAKALMDELENSEWVTINTHKFRFGDNEWGVIGTSREARKYMAERSKKYGSVFTKEPM